VRVQAGAEITDSVVMQDVVIGRSARVHRAILDKLVKVEAGAVVGGSESSPDSNLAWLDGLTLVGKDAVIPEGALIGPQVVVGVGSEPEIPAGGLTPARAIPDRPALQDLV
jgi:glucose-1-phosphate adenylyltransferase